VGGKMHGVNKHKIRLFVLKKTAKKNFKRIAEEVKKRFEVTVSVKTLRRWEKRFSEGWNLMDKSSRPRIIHRKITPRVEHEIVALRRKTGYEAWKIKRLSKGNPVHLSESSIKRVIAKHGLSRGSKMKGERLKWVRWQRSVPNDLWQLDHTEEEDGTLRLAVIDDCSRYCLAVRHYESITTEEVTKLLDELATAYGKPKQILTDNGSIYQEQFDKWCSKKKIEHIRTKVNKPTTVGKVEKIHDTYSREIQHWKTPEKWRYQYNQMRPHRSLDGKTPSEVYNEFHRLLFYNREESKK
jgi:putative transposase